MFQLMAVGRGAYEKIVKVERHNKLVLTIRNFWAPRRCKKFIELSEQRGYVLSKIQGDNGQRLAPSVRNNQRVIFEDSDLASEIYHKVKPFLEPKIGNSRLVGLNEMFRFYKYESGQKFRKHRDQSYIRSDKESSYFTFMIYLNSEFKGGETRFNDVTIAPEQGAALIFLHDLEHEGAEVIEGVKYVLRTDIMYCLDVVGED